MRARNIKPGIFKNEDLGTADPLYTLLFEGLWCMADREGRLEDRPLRIKGEVFPYREVDVGPMLAWLTEKGFIVRYESAGHRYIQVVAFKEHQHPHHTEKASKIPRYHGDAPEKEVEKGVAEPLKNGEQTVTLRLIPDSLIPDSLIPDQDVRTPENQNSGKAAGPPPGGGMDRVKAVPAARRIVEAYQKKVACGHGRGQAETVVRELLESNVPETDLYRAIDSYAAASRQKEPRIRFSVERFFRSEWGDYRTRDPTAATQSAADLDAEAKKRLAALRGEPG